MINRRKFIKKLGLLFSVTPLTLLARTKPVGYKLTTLKVAGLQYGETSDSIFLPTENLQLKRELENTYDKYAIAIYNKTNEKVGYIPKSNARILASLIDNGVSLRANVRYFDKHKPVWDRLWIEIWDQGSV